MNTIIPSPAAERAGVVPLLGKGWGPSSGGGGSASSAVSSSPLWYGGYSTLAELMGHSSSQRSEAGGGGTTARRKIDDHMPAETAEPPSSYNGVVDQNYINQSYKTMQLYVYNYYAGFCAANNVPTEQACGIIVAAMAQLQAAWAAQMAAAAAAGAIIGGDAGADGPASAERMDQRGSLTTGGRSADADKTGGRSADADKPNNNGPRESWLRKREDVARPVVGPLVAADLPGSVPTTTRSRHLPEKAPTFFKNPLPKFGHVPRRRRADHVGAKLGFQSVVGAVVGVGRVGFKGSSCVGGGSGAGANRKNSDKKIVSEEVAEDHQDCSAQDHAGTIEQVAVFLSGRDFDSSPAILPPRSNLCVREI